MPPSNQKAGSPGFLQSAIDQTAQTRVRALPASSARHLNENAGVAIQKSPQDDAGEGEVRHFQAGSPDSMASTAQLIMTYDAFSVTWAHNEDLSGLKTQVCSNGSHVPEKCTLRVPVRRLVCCCNWQWMRICKKPPGSVCAHGCPQNNQAPHQEAGAR